MTPPALLRWSNISVGIALVILNLLHLAYGLPRLRSRIAGGEVSPGLATPFLVAWLYVGLAGLGLGVLLLLLAPDVAAGNAIARKAVLTIGLILIVLGASAFALARSHPGLLLISVFGAIVAVPVLLYRLS